MKLIDYTQAIALLVLSPLALLAVVTSCRVDHDSASAASADPYEWTILYSSSGPNRMENSEAVCYQSGYGLSCHWKDKK